MLPLNKVELNAYRLSGLIGSCFTLSQSIIWLALSITGAICKSSACGSNYYKNSFAYCFYLTYYYDSQNSTDNSTRGNFISPTSFNAIMWFSASVSIANFIISAITAQEFFFWTNAKNIKIMAKVWPICIICFSCIELVLCLIFVYDIVSVNQSNENIKCFMKTNLEILRSSNTNERSPAPYLLQLKSNLQIMKRKIKKLKENLLFLDAIVDIKSPNHLKNPFISKKLANNYVEKVWRNMFNNNIGDTVLHNKSDIFPSDEMLKDFLISAGIDLDEMDYDLIKSFDGLTNNKWIKPVKSSNVVFAKKFDLSPNIKLQSSNTIDNLSNLLLFFFKQINEQPSNHTELYQKLDKFFDDLFGKLKVRNKNNKCNKNKTSTNINDNLETNNNEKEEFLLKLIQVIDNMIEEQNQAENATSETQNKIPFIKDIFENDDITNNNNEEILNKIKESFKYQYHWIKDVTKNLEETTKVTSVQYPWIKDVTKNLEETTKVKSVLQFRNINDKTTTKKLTTPPSTNKYQSNLVKELCEHCSSFVLGPSILCMIMSLKMGLIWLLNIAIAIITLYYDSLIEIKRIYFF